MNKASCLSRLCNAVLVWNTVQMSRIIEQLRATGSCTYSLRLIETDLSHTVFVS